MKAKKIIFSLILISIFISFTHSIEFNYEKFKEKSFTKKIKYLIISFFNFIEQYTKYILFGLNLRYTEPYDFLIFFIAGCIFRLICVIIKKIFKNIFNMNDNYVYNQPDNTESLYIVIKKLEELQQNLNDLCDGNKKEEIKDNNINGDKLKENNLFQLKELEENSKVANSKLINIEKCIKMIENNYNEQKLNKENILKTTQECQQIIKNFLDVNNK